MAKYNNTDDFKPNPPSLLDYLFGTSFQSGKNENYQIEDIIALANQVNGAGNLQYVFYDGANPEKTHLSTGVFSTNNNKTNPSQITVFRLNKNSLHPVDLTLLFQKIKDTENSIIGFYSTENPSIFLEYKITSVVEYTDYFEFNVSGTDSYCLGSLENKMKFTISFKKGVAVQESNTNVFVQQNDPAFATPYVWFQTNESGSLVSIWINKV